MQEQRGIWVQGLPALCPGSSSLCLFMPQAASPGSSEHPRGCTVDYVFLAVVSNGLWEGIHLGKLGSCGREGTVGAPSSDISAE